MKLSYLLLLSACLPLGAADTKPKDVKSMKTAAAGKIAVVDMNQIMSIDPQSLSGTADEWRDLFKKIQDVVEPAQKELAQLQEEVMKKEKELQALEKSGVTSPEAFQERIQKEYMPLRQRLEAQGGKLNQYFTQERYNAENTLRPKLEKAVDAVVEAQGWDFAIRKDMLPSRKVSNKFDITEEVLIILNRDYAESKKAPSTN